MASRHLQQVTFFLAIAAFAAGQKASIMPADLQVGFSSDKVQVSFTDEAINGFQDGTVFTEQEVAKEPTFALGDSNGISPETLYTIIMVDTTCEDARTLHFAQANFKNNFDVTNIASETEAALPYIAPGSLGETGDGRQYSFMMYEHRGRKEITELQLPAEGEAFDVKVFQAENGLPDAMAGVAMVVDLEGEVNCGASPVALNATAEAGAVNSTLAANSTEVANSTVVPSVIESVAEAETAKASVADLADILLSSGGLRAISLLSQTRVPIEKKDTGHDHDHDHDHDHKTRQSM
ncbi:hypothetical protein PTT_00415 [Pyrenophora teres f. teres 0-1]|uniref:Uncharacterized protein n=1 Tax=Pyrenophora teres f. teres (strain 0-1) TaxID=861557 RepID=E3RCH1_PYRTT|nr:hypothetical protein PTT_00415 [Pyrenophora teres f. teres 0-1]